MTVLRRVVLAAALIGIAICVVLLLNFTADNPTGRRYSSETLRNLESGDGTAIGQAGERIIGHDLDHPNNNDQGQRQCVCGASVRVVPSECQACIAKVPALTSYRIPDFVANDYIVEVKNRVSLSVNERSIYNQLRDYAAAAEELGVPFWLFVRTNTVVPNEIERLARRTGGGVVYYLAVPGYSDPVDRDATRGLIACGAVASGLLLWELRERRLGPRLSPPHLPRLHLGRRGRKSPRAPVDEAEQLLDRVKSRADTVRTPDDPDEPPTI